MAGQSGQNSVTGIGATGGGTNWNTRNETDFGTQTAYLYTYAVIGSTNVTVGVDQTADDLNFIAAAIKEYTPPTTFVRDIIQSSGFIPFAR
jgi:hypothetical protein